MNQQNPFLSAGFRPFFLFAALYAISSQVLWMALYVFQWRAEVHSLSLYSWHSHEMIYGYAVAVIAGFLLTAARNWTGQKTLEGLPLLILLILWLLPRVLFWMPGVPLALIALLDIGSDLFLLFAILRPVIKVKQWRQKIIVLMLTLLALGNISFYLAHLGGPAVLIRVSLYGGLYLIVGLILLMGRRVIPMFTERGIPDCEPLINHNWVDRSLPIFYVAFVILDLASPNHPFAGLLCGILATLTLVRLIGWYRHSYWSWPMVWVLHLAYFWIAMGFLLKALSQWGGISPYLALHAFAYGGIGTITLGMMSRVSLGHTGRSVTQAPTAIKWAFIACNSGVIVRVFLPLIMPEYYPQLIFIAQVFWILSFIIFMFVYMPFLLRQRL